MKAYKLRLIVSMEEVMSFDSPGDSTAEESADPVKRDANEQNQMLKLASQMVDRMQPRRPQPMRSHLCIQRSFDVPSGSMEEAARVLKRFEELGATVGMACDGDATMPPHLEGGF